jgi:hypothetical protein
MYYRSIHRPATVNKKGECNTGEDKLANHKRGSLKILKRDVVYWISPNYHMGYVILWFF